MYLTDDLFDGFSKILITKEFLKIKEAIRPKVEELAIKITLGEPLLLNYAEALYASN
jgi:hypothetical protein